MTSVGQTVAPGAAPQQPDAARPAPAAPTPQSHPGAVDAPAGEVAPLGDRALAALVDTVALGGAFAVIGNWAAARWGGATSSGFEMTGTPAAVTIALTGLVGFIYYWVLEGTVGATAGKAIVGLRVRRADGSAPGMGASFTRNVCRLIDGFAFYLVGWIVASFSKRRQRLGDHLAHTIVVPDSKRSGRVMGAVGLVAWCVAVVVGVIAIRHGGAQATPASAAAGRAVASGARTDGSPLVLSNVVWMDRPGGSPQSSPYAPGSTVAGTYELNGFANASGRVGVAIHIIPTDPDGQALADPIANDVSTTTGATGPIRGQFQVSLPPFVPAGTYTMRILVHDAVGNSDAEFRPAFTVSASPLTPAGALEVRNAILSNTEGGDAAAHPVYHAGQTLYFAAQLSGMQFRHDSADAKIGLAVIDPQGTAVMSKDDWATIAERFVYHPNTFFVPARGSLTLPSPLAPGTYAVRYTITDNVAATKVIYDAPFEVQ